MPLISSLFGRSPIRPMQQHMEAATACATLLTLIVVPVLYVIFFHIPYEADPDAVKEEICA